MPSLRPTTTAAFHRTDSQVVHDGHLKLLVDTFRYTDGRQARREIVEAGEVVCVVAVDGSDVVLVRQPREAAGEAGMLELVAGGVEPGEDPARAAERELAEEIGKRPGRLTHLRTFQSSPGVMYEPVHLYLAEDLTDHVLEADEDERIDVVRWPVSDISGLLAQVRDAKAIIGLHELAARLRTTT